MAWWDYIVWIAEGLTILLVTTRELVRKDLKVQRECRQDYIGAAGFESPLRATGERQSSCRPLSRHSFPNG